ncbi:unnamed protein product [Paramecium sonneborni]|uniref:Uncharacterized protein n=1 Tax=Paramecium sonneborni TaxID=65129 RepID=A0A8S1LDZ2_9CILI|nr:unnamed protein product [Paramecium sonneborni]
MLFKLIQKYNRKGYLGNVIIEFGNGKLKIIRMVQKRTFRQYYSFSCNFTCQKTQLSRYINFFYYKNLYEQEYEQKTFMIAKKNAHEFKINIKQHQFKHFKHLQKLHLEWIDSLQKQIIVEKLWDKQDQVIFHLQDAFIYKKNKKNSSILHNDVVLIYFIIPLLQQIKIII